MEVDVEVQRGTEAPDEGDRPGRQTAAIYGAAGTTMNVSIMPPGQGPCRHAHDNTFETFVVLDGTIEFRVGPAGTTRVGLMMA